MQITKEIEIVDLGLKIDKTLIISDLQLGYEESLAKTGVLLPRFQAKDIMKRLEEMLRTAKPEMVIINGDLKHEFGTISNQEWRDVLRVLDLILKYADEIIIVKGNHDLALAPIAKKRNITMVDSFEAGEKKDILIIHGHKEIDIPKNIKTVIIGHEHPAVSIKEDIRVEKFKCFLKGDYKGKELIVMPSMNVLVEGTDITKGDILSPFLERNLDNFEVFIVADKVYAFGKLGKLNG